MMKKSMKKTAMSTPKRQRDTVAYAVVFGIWILSLALSLAVKNEKTLQRYHLTPAGLRTIQVVYDLPALFMWLAVLFACLSFYRYSRQIAGSADSPGFRYIAYALTAMLVSFIASGLINNLQAL